MLTFLATFLIALVLTILLTPMVRSFAPEIGAIDKPSERKVHTKNTPRTGGIAIFFGSGIAELIPAEWIRWIAGIVFIVFGLLTLRNHAEEKADAIPKTFVSTFLLLLLSEMGDKSQIATLLFAARFDPLFVFIGAFAALVLLAIASIWIGKALAKRLDHRTVSFLSGALFILAGIGFLFF